MPWYHKVLINDLSPEYPEDKIILFQLHSQSNQMAEEYMGGLGAIFNILNMNYCRHMHCCSSKTSQSDINNLCNLKGDVPG